jgi:hypothetical protein
MESPSSPVRKTHEPKLGNPARKQNIWFGKIETADYAERIIKDVSNGLYFLGILQGVIEYLVLSLGFAGIIDGVILLVLGFFIGKQSRVTAVILLLYSFLIFVTTIAAAFGVYPGGHNIVLAVILIWVAVRSVQATFTLYRLKSNP